MSTGGNEPELSWRARVANTLALMTMIALGLAVVIVMLANASPRLAALALYVFTPVLALLAFERYVIGAGDYRVRAWLTIGSLLIVGVVSATTVGLLGGTAATLFVALTLTSLLFGMRAMVTATSATRKSARKRSSSPCSHRRSRSSAAWRRAWRTISITRCS